jgi:hypothetical protein
MDTSQNAEFRRRLEGLAEVFDTKLSPQRIALYFAALMDLELPAVVIGLNQAVRVCKFFPRPAEIRTLVLGDSEDRAEAAWLAFRQAMRVAGSYASVSIQDAALGEAILSMFGSWPAACAQELSQEMWSSKRKEFGRVYRVLCQRNLDGARYLPGICEQQNAGRRDWLKFVTVYRLDAGGISPALSLEAAEQERQQIAAVSSGMAQLRDALPSTLRLVNKTMDETA